MVTDDGCQLNMKDFYLAKIKIFNMIKHSQVNMEIR